MTGGEPDARKRARAGPWTSPADLRARLLKDWDSGRLPSALLGGESPFPLRVGLKGPSSTELGERFEEARRWIGELSAAAASPGYELEWRDVRHQQLGRNSVPVAAIFAAPEDALRFAGRQREGSRLLRLAREIEEAFPSLRPWMLRRPLAILEHAEEWPSLLGTLSWFRSHPRSGLYARQIDTLGVHGKFVESHRGLLAELLDLVLEPGAIVGEASGASGFNRRYGLRDKPLMVRFRSLDPRLGFGIEIGAKAIGLMTAQLSLAAEDFARLFTIDESSPFRQIFITENEINFLAFPDHPSSMIVFGGGYGFASLQRAEWLRCARLRYWGDLDTHGFAILDQFRALFPEAESFLMDRATLLAHRGLWTAEASPASAALSRLREEERELYDEIRSGRLARSLRLEQERIGFSWLEAALSDDRECT